MSEPIPLPTHVTYTQLVAACEALGIDTQHVRRFDLARIEVETWEVRVVRYTTWPPSLVSCTDGEAEYEAETTVDVIPVGWTAPDDAAEAPQIAAEPSGGTE